MYFYLVNQILLMQHISYFGYHKKFSKLLRNDTKNEISSAKLYLGRKKWRYVKSKKPVENWNETKKVNNNYWFHGSVFGKHNFGL